MSCYSMRTRALLLLAFALWLAPSASAAPSLVAAGQSYASWDVALNGPDVLWVGPRIGVLWRGRPGNPVVGVRKLGGWGAFGYYESGTDVPSISASGSRVAYTTEAWDSAASKFGKTGRLPMTVNVIDLASRRITRLIECDNASAASVDLDGPLLVTSGCASGPVELRDLDHPGKRPARLAGSATRVAVSGRRIAWRKGAAFTVLHVDTGARRDVDADELPGEVSEWALDADGTLAFLLKPRGGLGPPYRCADNTCSIAVSAPDGSPARVVGGTGSYRNLHLARGRLAYVRSTTNGILEEVVVMPLDGVARVLAQSVGVTALDFDGVRLAYPSADCSGGTRIFTQSADEPATTDLSIDICRPSIEYRASVDRRGRLHTGEINCPELVPPHEDDTCTMTAVIRAGKFRHRTARPQRTGSSQRFVFPPSRWLLRHRPRHVHIEVRTIMRGGIDRSVRRLTVRYGKRSPPPVKG